jgi:sporulation protein YqfD
MKLFRSLTGFVTVEVISADIPGVLTTLGKSGIPIYDICQVDSLTVQLVIDRSNHKNAASILDKRGEDYRLIRRRGLFWTVKRQLRRPVLVVGLCILLLLTVFLPTKVLFVKVEGNSSVPSRLILERAEECGIAFSTSRAAVRSERIKNNLLEAIPELQWVGVNTYGCVAVIRVRERSQPPQSKSDNRVSSIVAVRDGVIQSINVNRGTVLCARGQAVTKGQILISGYTDCGFLIKAEQAEGEILAQTNRELTVLTPEKSLSRAAQTLTERKFSLILGKFRINFYKDSGILDSTCVKMYSENYMTLPGGFRLPVALAVEERISCHIGQSAQKDCSQTLRDFAQRYLQSQMTAGQILRREEQIDGCQLEGQYACLEMIGQVRYEESITENENH